MIFACLSCFAPKLQISLLDTSILKHVIPVGIAGIQNTWMWNCGLALCLIKEPVKLQITIHGTGYPLPGGYDELLEHWRTK